MIKKEEAQEWIEWVKKVNELKARLARLAQKIDENLRQKQILDLKKESDRKRLGELEKITTRLRANYLKGMAECEELLKEQEILEKKYKN